MGVMEFSVMIDRIKGEIIDRKEKSVVLSVGFFGIEVFTTYLVITSGPGEVRLYTHLVTREDSYNLYGFKIEAEREAFRKLIKINGVGPRMALSLINDVKLGGLTMAILDKDTARLKKVKGIGDAIANKIIENGL